MYTKHMATGGQGGLVYTRDERLFWEIKRYADRGKAFNLPTADGSRVAPLDCDVNDLGDNVQAGLNSNSTEMACVLGIEQIRKLPGMIERRAAFGEQLKSRLERESRAVRLGWQPPDTQPSYWFLRFHFASDRLGVSKEEFCRELRAEGIPVTTTWRKIPCEMPWFKEKRVFGDSGFPWTCSDYGGDRNPQFKTENIDRAVEQCFTMPINENFGARELDDIMEAVLKIEAAYARS
jgi:dTDP-4-amino-4,6-dideoxygalactose transaminase